MIGIFGGTFDPVHFGHLRPALEVLQELDLKQVRLIPCRQPPHRDEPVASPDMRLKMLESALQSITGLIIDRRELEREGPSYMVDTLETIRSESAQTLCLLLGMDAFAGLDQWHQWRKIFELAHIVVMERPGSEVLLSSELADELAQRRINDVSGLRLSKSGKVFFCTVTQLEISASMIRKLLVENKSPRYLLPDSVLEIIDKEQVYANF